VPPGKSTQGSGSPLVAAAEKRRQATIPIPHAKNTPHKFPADFKAAAAPENRLPPAARGFRQFRWCIEPVDLLVHLVSCRSNPLFTPEYGIMASIVTKDLMNQQQKNIPVNSDL